MQNIKLHIGRGLLVYILGNIFMIILCKINPENLESNTMIAGIIYSMLCTLPAILAAIEIK